MLIQFNRIWAHFTFGSANFLLTAFSLISFLQWVLSPKYFKFPFPITLTMIHMGFSGAVAILLVRVFKVWFACFNFLLMYPPSYNFRTNFRKWFRFFSIKNYVIPSFLLCLENTTYFLWWYWCQVVQPVKMTFQM